MMGHIFNYTNQQKWKTRDAVYCFDWAFPGVDWESLGPNELCRVWNLSRGEQYGHFLSSDVLFVDIGSWVCKAWLKMKAEQEKKVQKLVNHIEHVKTEYGLGGQEQKSCADNDRFRFQVLASGIEKLREEMDELKFNFECDKKTSEAYLQHLNDRINKLEKDDTVAKIARLEKELEQETILRNALYDSLKKGFDMLQNRVAHILRS